MFQTYPDSTNVIHDSQPVLHAPNIVEKTRGVDTPCATHDYQQPSPQIASLPSRDHPSFVDTTHTNDSDDMENDTVDTRNNSWTDGSGGEESDDDVNSDESDEDDMEVCIFYDFRRLNTL